MHRSIKNNKTNQQQNLAKSRQQPLFTPFRNSFFDDDNKIQTTKTIIGIITTTTSSNAIMTTSTSSNKNNSSNKIIIVNPYVQNVRFSSSAAAAAAEQNKNTTNTNSTTTTTKRMGKQSQFRNGAFKRAMKCATNICNTKAKRFEDVVNDRNKRFLLQYFIVFSFIVKSPNYKILFAFHIARPQNSKTSS